MLLEVVVEEDIMMELMLTLLVLEDLEEVVMVDFLKVMVRMEHQTLEEEVVEHLRRFLDRLQQLVQVEMVDQE